jgi:hypothetical protein
MKTLEEMNDIVAIAKTITKGGTYQWVQRH